MSLYSTLCHKSLFPVADLASGNYTMSYYNFYTQSQWWDRSKLKRYQNNLYRELYDNCSTNIEGIASVEDLYKLPAVSKELLRQSYPNGCTRNTGLSWREYCNSGSSGKPFAVRVDNLTISQARALMFLRANYSGWEIGEPFLQTGMTLQRGFIKKFKDIFLRCHYVSAFNLSDDVLDSYLQMIDRHQLKYIMGYAGSMYCLAVRANEIGFNNSLNGVVSWGDNLYQHYRDKIEQAFKCRVTDTYGCGEGIQIAAQCGMNNGAYHIFMPHVIVEIVDDDGQPVKPGEMGNILLTRLDAGAMPLIRYKVGDIGRKSPDESCPCGRGLEMLAKIEGRDTDVIVTPNGNRLIVHFFTGIFEYYQSVDTFKVIQEKPGEIIVELVPMPDFQEAHWSKIKAEILAKGDPDLKIELKVVKEIPLEKSYKRRFVISRINNSI
jgi:phenylacetate-CoA ligase